MTKQRLKDIRTHLSWAENILLTGFGSGWLKPAPGTWGSLAGLITALPIVDIGGISLLLFLTVVTFVISTQVIDRIEARTGVHDAGEIVIDEWVGQWLALIPVFYCSMAWQWCVVAFALFRFFDILKPWPISWLDQKVSGGFGVMIDDVLAGVFAAMVLTALYFGAF